MNLTWNDFYLICQSQKPSTFKPPDWMKVKSTVAQKLSICQDELINETFVVLKSRYGKYVKGMKAKTSSQRATVETDVVFDSENFTPVQDVPPKRTRKSLDELGKRQLKARTDDLWKTITEYAEENNETCFRILALLLKKCSDKNARKYGDEVWKQTSSDSPQPPTSKTISIDAAMAIMVDCQLGRESYTKLCKILKQQGHDILPPWIHIRKTQSGISPTPKPLPDPHDGVQMSYAESVKITAQRIMESLPPSAVPSAAVMNIKFGFVNWPYM